MNPQDLYPGCLVNAWYRKERKHGKIMDMYFNEELKDGKDSGFWFLMATDFHRGSWKTVEIHESDLVL